MPTRIVFPFGSMHSTLFRVNNWLKNSLIKNVVEKVLKLPKLSFPVLLIYDSDSIFRILVSELSSCRGWGLYLSLEIDVFVDKAIESSEKFLGCAFVAHSHLRIKLPNLDDH